MGDEGYPDVEYVTGYLGTGYRVKGASDVFPTARQAAESHGMTMRRLRDMESVPGRRMDKYDLARMHGTPFVLGADQHISAEGIVTVPGDPGYGLPGADG